MSTDHSVVDDTMCVANRRPPETIPCFPQPCPSKYRQTHTHDVMYLGRMIDSCTLFKSLDEMLFVCDCNNFKTGFWRLYNQNATMELIVSFFLNQ